MPASPIRCAALITATVVATGGMLLASAPAFALDHTVTDFASLHTAITNAVDGDVIIFDNTITAAGALPDITADITIEGAGFAYDGIGAHGGLYIDAATVSIVDLTITDTTTFAVSTTATSSISLDELNTNSGISTFDSDVTILRSTFTLVESYINGTGIVVDIRNSTFNDSDSDGVSIDVADATVTLTDVGADGNDSDGIDVEVWDNTVLTATALTLQSNGDNGLELDAYDGATATITDSTATGNDSNGFDLYSGGDSSVTISDSSGTNNDSDGFSFYTEADGAAITAMRVVASDNGDDGIQIEAFDGSAITITDSTSDSNEFGIYFSNMGGTTTFPLITVRSSTISNNDYYGFLGAIEADSVVVVENSTISGNGTVDDERGFGVNGEGSLTIAHSTVTGNSGDDGPGSRSNEFSGDLVLVIDHSIFASNNAEFDLEVEPEVTLTVSHSLVGTAGPNASAAITGGVGNLPLGTSAALGTLADNGGTTLTHLPSESSPAINAGNAGIVGAPTTDQRGAGFPRLVGTIDIGAVESPALLAATGSDPAPLGAGAIALLGLGMAILFGAARSRHRGAASANA